MRLETLQPQRVPRFGCPRRSDGRFEIAQACKRIRFTGDVAQRAKRVARASDFGTRGRHIPETKRGLAH